MKLMNALNRLYSDKDYYNFLSTNSKKVFEERYTLEKMGRNVGEICNSVKGAIPLNSFLHYQNAWRGGKYQWGL